MKTPRRRKIAMTIERSTHRITNKQQAAQGLFLKAIRKTAGPQSAVTSRSTIRCSTLGTC